MIVGADLDGTLTLTSLNNFKDSKLPWWCATWLILVRPNKKMITILREFARKGNTIIIVSARPKQLKGLTKLWLKIHQVPFDKVRLVNKGNGIEKRKLEIIREMKVEEFFDDDTPTVKYLKEHGINARLP